MLLLVQLAALFLSTTVYFVDAGEQAVREHYGKPAGVYGPGAHFKLPWPADHVYRFRTEQIQSFDVGYTPDQQGESAKIILWTVGHGKEDNFLVGNRVPAMDASATTNDPAATKPLGLISVSIPIQFQITDLTKWIYNNSRAARFAGKPCDCA